MHTSQKSAAAISLSTRSTSPDAKTATADEPILYIVQAKSRLPEHYECIRDKVYLVSWGEKSDETDLYLPNSTWTSGRNAAHKAVKESGKSYEYVIFLDDDIAFKGRSQAEGFRLFEQFLSQEKPAIGIPECWCYNSSPSQIPSLPYNVQKKGMTDNMLQLQSVDWFDAAMNAFRWDVFQSEALFPYDERYDAQSWWCAQFVMILRANFFYRQQVVQNNTLTIQNTSNQSDYPRSSDCFWEVYRDFLQDQKIKFLKMTDRANYIASGQPPSEQAGSGHIHIGFSSLLKEAVKLLKLTVLVTIKKEHSFRLYKYRLRHFLDCLSAQTQ